MPPFLLLKRRSTTFRLVGTTGAEGNACRGGNLPPATFRIQPVRMNGTTYRHVIPSERKRVEESSQVASFTLRWSFLQRGGFLHSADATVGMTYLRGDFVYPHRLSLQRGGRLVAVPTSKYYVFHIFQRDIRIVAPNFKRNETFFNVGAATCRPPRSEYNPCG